LTHEVFWNAFLKRYLGHFFLFVVHFQAPSLNVLKNLENLKILWFSHDFGLSNLVSLGRQGLPRMLQNVSKPWAFPLLVVHFQASSLNVRFRGGILQFNFVRFAITRDAASTAFAAPCVAHILGAFTPAFSS
jgi:hypothetical protein